MFLSTSVVFRWEIWIAYFSDRICYFSLIFMHSVISHIVSLLTNHQLHSLEGSLLNATWRWGQGDRIFDKWILKIPIAPSVMLVLKVNAKTRVYTKECFFEATVILRSLCFKLQMFMKDESQNIIVLHYKHWISQFKSRHKGKLQK